MYCFKKIYLLATFQECESLLYHLSQIKMFFSVNEYTIVTEIEEADVIFLAGCVAGQEMEDYFFRVYNAIKIEYPEKVVIPTGCIVDYKDNLDGIGSKGLELLNKFKHRVSFNKVEVEILDPVLSSRSISFHRIKDYYIQISQGCANKCSFCATRKAKGFVLSNSEDEILQKITRLKLEKAASRFILLSDDCGSYGLDKQTNIIELSNHLKSYKKAFFSLNFFEPGKLERYFSEIDECFWEKVFYIGIPIQSTSDRLVKLMNRNYLVSDIVKIVQKIKTINPHITIATCIMFGVPTETKREFDSLLSYNYPFDKVVFFPFSSRSGTLMGEMEQVSISEKDQRIDMVRKLSKSDNRVGIMEQDLYVKFYNEFS